MVFSTLMAYPPFAGLALIVRMFKLAKITEFIHLIILLLLGLKVQASI